MRKRPLHELGRPSLSDFRDRPKHPLVLVLDNVRSGLNVGSVFRTADAFALERLVLCGITARPPHREILKTAIGATESVAWTYEEDTLSAVRRLKTDGYRLLAVEQAEGSVNLLDFGIEPGPSYALVFGNEVRGVDQAVLDEMDGALEVPQYGTKHSLNIAVCAGIVCWELVRQWKRPR